MVLQLKGYDLSGATHYHYGGFPPQQLDYERLIEPLTVATAALARYDAKLTGLHNSEILLTSLRGQEAVLSSRMEGTFSTLDEVLRVEADNDAVEQVQGTRHEAVEVAMYASALRRAQRAIDDGQPISEYLIRQAHRHLLSYGRGAYKGPGEYKSEQNYIGDEVRRTVSFVPISPEQLPPAMEALINFVNHGSLIPILIAAFSHVEFEALHPFNDGNGRIGRMLITLTLWKKGLISRPNFYISGFFEERRGEYIDRMRAVSEHGDWTGWAEFFLSAVTTQAQRNTEVADQILNLYNDMKPVFGEALASKHTMAAQDFIFANPIFRNSRFTGQAGIPAATAARLARSLLDRGLLVELVPASGRRAALYSFEPLMNIVRM